MKKTIYFLFFILLLVLISFTSSSNYNGYLNQSGFILYYNLNVFNDSNLNKIITINKGSDISINVRLPKNITVQNAYLNISGNQTNFLELTFDKEISLQNTRNYTGGGGGLAYNGSHFYLASAFSIGESNRIYVYNKEGVNIENISTNVKEWAVTVSSTTNTVWTTNSVNLDIIRRRGSENPDGIYNMKFGVGGFFFNGTYFYGFGNPNWNIYNISGVNIGNFSTNNGNFADRITFCNHDINCDKRYFYTAITDTIFKYRFSDISNDTVISSVENTLHNITGIDGISLNSTHFWISVFPTDGNISIFQYTYRELSFPKNVTLNINGTIFFNNSNVLNTSNTTIDFSTYLQSSLSTCIADLNGYCNIPLNVSSDDNGTIILSNLQINYTYNATSNFDIINWWNITSNFVVGTTQGISKYYQLSKNSSTELNISSFRISESATVCYIDGTSKTIGSDVGYNYCNLTSSQIINSTGGTYTNHNIYDGTLGTNSPVNQTNGTQSSSGTNQTLYFNVTAYYPNGTIVNDTALRFYNITTEITLTENNLFLNISPTYGLKWYNDTNWLDLNVTNVCSNSLAETELNYSNITIGSDLWQGCHNDTNSNGEIDYFKILIPHLSNQQFYAYHEEDNTAPTISFTTPTGTYTSLSGIPFNVTVTDNVAVDSCKYNITTDSGGVEKSTTSIDCGNFSGTFTVSGNDDFYFYAWANDTANNERLSSQSFAVNAPASPTGGGGGGAQIIKNVTTNISQIINCSLGEVYYEGRCVSLALFNMSLKLTPPKLHKYFIPLRFYTSPKDEVRELVKSNKILKSCTTKGPFICIIINKTEVLITAEVLDTNFLSKPLTGEAKLEDISGFVNYLPIDITVLSPVYSIKLTPTKLSTYPKLMLLFFKIRNKYLIGVTYLGILLVITPLSFIGWNIYKKRKKFKKS